MNAHRTVLEADLAPLAGSLIQPTGFPDLGAAEFGDRHCSAGRVGPVDGELAGGHHLGQRAQRAGRRTQRPALRPHRQPGRRRSCPQAAWKPTAWRPPTS